MSLWDYIVWPFARLMEFLYNWTQNYGIAVILFALVVNLILLPIAYSCLESGCLAPTLNSVLA